MQKKCSFSFFLKTLFSISTLSRIICHPNPLPLFPYYQANNGIREILWSICLLLRVLIENKGFSTFFNERIFEKLTSNFLHPTLRDLAAMLISLLRRLKPTVNKVLSLRDIASLTQHYYKLFIFRP